MSNVTHERWEDHGQKVTLQRRDSTETQSVFEVENQWPNKRSGKNSTGTVRWVYWWPTCMAARPPDIMNKRKMQSENFTSWGNLVSNRRRKGWKSVGVNGKREETYPWHEHDCKLHSVGHSGSLRVEWPVNCLSYLFNKQRRLTLRFVRIKPANLVLFGFQMQWHGTQRLIRN